MTASEPRLRSLLRQAKKVADAGKRSAAEGLYRQIIKESPDSEAAWLGLAQVVADESEKQAAYERVLALAPDNERAKVGLAQLRPTGEPEVESEKESDPFDLSRDWLNEATSRSGQSPPAAAPPAEEKAPTEARDHGHDHVDQDPGDQDASYDLVCYRHLNRETSLRCYSCGRPICSICAVKTPVGYRCPTCIREAEDVFFTAQVTDYIVAPLVSFPLALLAGYLVLQFRGGFFFIFLMLFIGGAIGGLIGRVAKRAVGRRRGRYLSHVVAFMVILGVGLPYLFFFLLGAAPGILVPGIYLFVATSSAFYQMK